MFPGTGNGLSFLKIIGGLSKTLTIAREIIPIYEQTKPMIQNARKAFSVLKNVNLKTTNTSSTTNINSKPIQTAQIPLPNKKTITNTSNSSINNPSFFR